MLSVKYASRFSCAGNLWLSESRCRIAGSRSLELLTYMSIRKEWMEHVEKERLFKLDPFPGDPNARTVLMSEELLKLTTRPMEEGEDGNRRSPLIASLQYIVAGRRLVVCMTPFKARKANLGRLDPIEDSIWDVRCQEKPALRVFCQFVEKDVLFAVTCRPRTVKMDWLGWVPLGDSN